MTEARPLSTPAELDPETFPNLMFDYLSGQWSSAVKYFGEKPGLQAHSLRPRAVERPSLPHHPDRKKGKAGE